MKQPGLRFRSVPSSMVLWLTAAILLSVASCADSSSNPEPCDDGRSPCGSTCADTKEDPDNCGACGQVCSTGQECQEGVCTGGEGGAGGGGAGGTGGTGGGCAEGQTDCAGSCVTLETDPTHCGSCEVVCSPGYTCADSVCVCPAATTECDGACLDLQSDVAHCGACDVQCGFNQICTAGSCECNDGFTACEGTCTNLAVNPQHCGSCETACAPRAFCREGSCSCIVGPYEDLGTTVPQTVIGTNVDAGGGYDLSCVAAGSTETVYLFTASEDGTFTFDTAGSGYDTALGLFNPRDCAERGCNDDFGESQARVTSILNAGESVLVVVTGFNGATGEFTLNINQAAPPVCPSGVIDPALPQTVTGNTAVLGDAIAPACGSSGSPDASYTFVAPHDGRYIFDTLGSEYNTILEIRDGSCDGASLACNDDFGGDQSRVSVTLTAGQTVVAVVDGYAGDGGPFTLNVSEYTPPPCPAVDLGSTVPQTVTGDTTGLENAIVAPCGSSGGVEIGYSFTAPADALYIFNTFGSGFDTVLYARDGTCGGTTLACNDDSGGLQSQIRVLLTAGQTIVVVVDGYSTTASGPFTLNVSQILIPPCPAADLGSTVPQTVTGTTAGLVDVLTPSCGGATSPETTYSFTAPETGTYIFDTFGSSFDTVLHLHDGTCAGPTLACNTDSGGPQSRVNVDLTAGQTVIIVVDGNFSTSGDYVLNVNQFTGGGTCATPVDLGSVVPQTVTGSTLSQPSSVTPVCGFSASAPDMLYSFTAPADGTYIFDTFGSAFNTVLQVLNGTCTGGSLACNDDSGGPQSRLNVDLTEGQTVLVAVDGASGAAGDYVLSVNQFIGAGTCSTAIDLGSTVPQTATGSTLLQPNSVTPTCGTSSAPDTVYTFTAPTDGTFLFDTFGSTFDTIIQLRDTDCAGAALACNNNAGGPQSRTVATLVAGQTVVVVVDGASSGAGDFVLNINEFVDFGICGRPIDLGSTVPQTVTGNTSLLFDLIVPACSFLSTAPESVFIFTAPSDGNFVADTIGSSYDTVLHVRNGAACSDAPLVCNDDSVGLQSRVTMSLTTGQVVTIVVDGYNTNSGNFTLNINPG